MYRLFLLVLLFSVTISRVNGFEDYFDVVYTKDPPPAAVVAQYLNNGVDGIRDLEDSAVYGSAGWMPLTLGNGSKYLCYVPEAEPSSVVTDPKSYFASTYGLHVRQTIPSQLRMRVSHQMANICSAKLDGWWTYEVCWEKHVRQFNIRQEQSKIASGAFVEVRTEYILGKGPQNNIEGGASFGAVVFQLHPKAGPFLSTMFYNGTVCDFTNEPRETELRLFCLEDSAKEAAGEAVGMIGGHSAGLIEVSEPTTCKYIVTLRSPQACIRELRSFQGNLIPITCHEV